MNSQDTAWVVVRAFGIYFAVQVFFEFFNVVLIVQQLFSMYEITASSASAETIQSAETRILLNWSRLPTSVVSFCVLSFLSFYCLRKGSKIHKLLMYRTGAANDT